VGRKFSGGRREWKRRSKNSTNKPLPGGEGAKEKRLKIAKKTER